ncbi:fumarylacetoacetate hydrolase [Rhodococcus opacus M213]|uniref:Fumarylacetoacetate hydrolase n=1 Tax=Rhodococcus opacus M213 TaxID=1129896 RepID=K8X5T8_RHOOP|nr:fumarylacetoacetate hydrolase family protein [Rhodococcus opacus]EKT76904.1 fumarylacetoacetate hydrolase [Rhodococcus opacus M213]
MKMIGIRDSATGVTQVARVVEDRAIVLADKAAFWSDPQGHLDRSAAADPAHGRPMSDVTEVPLVPDTARVLCIGLNYHAHANEGGFTVPQYPTIFGRWTASLSVGGVAVPVPANEAGLDWEGEIAAYVGAPLTDVDPDTARSAVLGYSTFNDLTARKAQKLTAQWTLGKNGDKSGPMGPLVTADEVGDLRDGLRLQTRVNGVTVQDGNTKSMIFDIGEVLSLVSQTMTLHPGDVVATGTPEGVGYVREPAWLLNDGDVVEVEVDRLGVLRTPIGGSR